MVFTFDPPMAMEPWSWAHGTRSTYGPYGPMLSRHGQPLLLTIECTVGDGPGFGAG
jgi:hypothetical protein